ncbi:N-6 DNA methylase [Anaerovoracaceae bacterium SGI.195]
MTKEVELSELLQKTFDSFEVKNINELRDKIFEIVIGNQHEYYEKFLEIAPDLEIDHMQKIYQYYLADRSELKQDYTPKSLSKLVSKLSENKKGIIDICAGTGALTIQSWAEDKTRSFKIYELDENVMSFLIFNMAIRNINCEIYQADVLEDKTFRKYLIIPGERFGEVILCQ